MTEHHDAAPPDEDQQDVAAVLEAQAAELADLHRELITSYEKELAFFANLDQRDREARAQDNARLKKIWWLETELRTQREEVVGLRAELERTRSALRNLQNSAMGRVQRSYWKMRQGARR